MTRRVVQRPKAIADVLDIVTKIALDSPVSAKRFFANHRLAVEGLTILPERARRYSTTTPGLGDIRVLTVPGFRNHLIFFQVGGGTIEIVRVLHGARDILVALGETD